MTQDEFINDTIFLAKTYLATACKTLDRGNRVRAKQHLEAFVECLYVNWNRFLNAEGALDSIEQKTLEFMDLRSARIQARDTGNYEAEANLAKEIERLAQEIVELGKKA